MTDACTSVIWRDDAQVVDLRASKQWTDVHPPGVHVEVRGDTQEVNHGR